MILVCPGSMKLVTGLAVFLTLGTAIDAEITQPNSMEYAEGKDVKLPCSHSIVRGNDYIHWYRQNPNQSPQYIIHGLRDTVNNTMASLTIATNRKSSTLILPRVTLRDSAVYYCSVSDTQWDRWDCTCAVSPWQRRVVEATAIESKSI